MVSTFTWVTMVLTGAVAIIVAMYMLSAYTDMRKKENDGKKKK